MIGQGDFVVGAHGSDASLNGVTEELRIGAA